MLSERSRSATVLAILSILSYDRADMPMQVVRQWTSIVAASELARKRNVNDEFLKNWIDVVDYQ